MFIGRKETKAWGPGGVAFLDLHNNKKHISFVRMYKISFQQFNDILKQENIRKLVGTSPLFTFNDLMSIRDRGYIFVRALKRGWYGTVLYLGDHEMLPVLTFTCPPEKVVAFKSNKIPVCAPSKGCRDILIKALVEQGGLPGKVAMSYIRDSFEKALNGSDTPNIPCNHL